LSTQAQAPSRGRFRIGAETATLLGLGLLTLLVVVVVHPGQLFIDTRPDLYLDPGALVRDCLSTWVPGTGLGSSNYDNGYLPLAVLSAALQKLGLEPWLVMRLWRFLLLVVAALGARRLLVGLTVGRRPAGPVARTTVAVLYAVNPYVVVGAATTPVMLPYALLPWALVALRRSFTRVWSGAAWVGVVFFLMGGLNAGVVPAYMLVAVPVVAVDAWRREGRSLWRVLRGLAASAVAFALVSAYWIAATVTALGTASAVAAATEDPRSVAAVSSYAETMRGLGSWLMYGGDALGPYRPGFVSYLDNPVTILASFTLPVLALGGAWLSRRRLRGVATALTVVGLVLMVGAHPPDDPSPFGGALLWGFDNVPGLIAFRTTSKAGALAMLGMALLGALLAEAAWPRLEARGRTWLTPTAALAVALSVTPVWIGRLFPGSLSVPDYWSVAAHDLDTRDGAGRLLALPAEANALYRWRPRGVDDFAPALLDREVVYSRSFPDGPESAWSSLSGVTGALSQSPVPPSLLSTYSDYLGATDVLVRNDMLWAQMGAPRPQRVTDAAEADPGLKASALYGPPGANTSAADDEEGETRLPPLIRYAVRSPKQPVRLFPAEDRLVVAGDNNAFASLVWAGLLDGNQPFQLLTDVGDGLADTLDEGGRVILTDSNRRHASNDHRVNLSGPLLSPSQDVENVRAVGDPSQQTVAVYDGIADLSATASGSVFGPTPDGRPYLAVDGDPTTAWLLGDFGSGLGESLTITFERPTSLTGLALSRPGGAGAHISTVRVAAGGEEVTAEFGSGDRVEVPFPSEVRATTMTLTITGVTGRSLNQVGLSEIELPGLEVREFARLPALPESVTMPVDVLLTRSDTEHEAGLNRVFQLPAASTNYRLTAVATGDKADWKRCRPLLILDGRTIEARAVRSTPDGGVLLGGCASIGLGTGTHFLVTDPDRGVERLLLSVPGGEPDPARATRPVSWTATDTSYDITTPATEHDTYLVIADAWDSRWRATVDGQDAGAPVAMNGFALGWRLPAGTTHHVVVTYTPQEPYDRALLLSLGAAGACLLVGLAGAVRGRRRAAQ